MIIKKINWMLVLSLVVLIGCGGGSSSSDTDDVNKAPKVNAGDDTTAIVNELVTVAGTATDEDGTISSYAWKKGEHVLGTEATLNYMPTKIGIDTLTFIATDDDGKSASDDVKITVKEENSLPIVDLPTTSRKKSSVFMQKADNEAIKNSVSTLAYAYYYRPNGNDKRWYISRTTILGEKVDVYSLMTGFKNNRNGWGTVGTKVASVDLKNETLTIGHIDDNPSYTYYDAGWGETTTNPIIQNDIELIRNQTVNIAWWFFQANNKWFIINKNGDVFKFITKTLSNGEKDIGWENVDMGGAKPNFFIEDGVKKMRFKTGSISPSTSYPKAVLSSKYYRVDENAFHEGLYGQCTWYVYGRFIELYAQGLISKKAYDTIHNGLYDTNGRDAKNWSSKLDIKGQGFLTKNDVLPLEKRKRGLLAVWECGKHGHVGFVEEIGGANKEWYILSDSNKNGDEKYQEKKYKFNYKDNVADAVDDKLSVIGGSCYPTFYDLEN